MRKTCFRLFVSTDGILMLRLPALNDFNVLRRQDVEGIDLQGNPIEYKPHKADVSTNYTRSYELAKASAENLNLILIKAAEITRGEPPGHLNALFLDPIEPLRNTHTWEAVKAAAEQGAFIFWNHPG